MRKHFPWILALLIVFGQLAFAQQENSGLDYKWYYSWITDNASVTSKTSLSDTLQLGTAPGSPSVGTGQGVMWQPTLTLGYKLSLQNQTLKEHYKNSRWYYYLKSYEVGYSWGYGPSAKNGFAWGTSPWGLKEWQRQSTFYAQGTFSGDNIRQMFSPQAIERARAKPVVRQPTVAQTTHDMMTGQMIDALASRISDLEAKYKQLLEAKAAAKIAEK